MIYIVCVSKPCDGLFYYSYEYCALLNDKGVPAKVLVIPHKMFTKQDYILSVDKKYIHCRNILFDLDRLFQSDVFLVMGRSMITLAFINFRDYDNTQKKLLRSIFSKKIIAVYSENHPIQYPQAIDFFKPQAVRDLCDWEVYPQGTGNYFEKRINFDIYKPINECIEFEHLFLGTNKEYYSSAERLVNKYSDHGILAYRADYVNSALNNVFVPTDNLLGKFKKYVYCKEVFDPAPRIIQECKYYSKSIKYERDSSIVDGGSIYMNRQIVQPDINPIITAYDQIH